MYKQVLALNNLQGLICHKIQSNHYNFLTAYGVKVKKWTLFTSNFCVLFK